MSNLFSVNNNASASDILANLASVQNQINSSYSQLSSGNRINSAADDPSGYAISQQMVSQVNGLNQSVQNAQNGVSLIQTATGAMNQIESIMQTMNTLAVEASNGTQNSADLSNLNQELNSLQAQIDSTANNTQFNTMNLLNGNFATTGVQLQVGAQNGQTLTFTIAKVSSTALGISSTQISVTSSASAQTAITSIQDAITSLSAYQANLGAVQNQLNFTISNLQNSATNLQNANATITNTDMATEYTQFSQEQVVQQVGMAMLGQAQQQPAAILKLLS